MKPDALTVHMELVTPAFVGGARPREPQNVIDPPRRERAELRVPSFKGALRFWFRAIDPAFAAHEARWFGGAGRDEGQSACLLRVEPPYEGSDALEKEPVPFPELPQRGRHLSYVGFSLKAIKPNREREGHRAREAVIATTRFKLIVQPRPGHDCPELRRAWLNAIWALGHLGGIGARSRRGFGSLEITSSDGWEDEARKLPLVSRASNPREWKEHMSPVLATLRQSRPLPAFHATMDQHSRVALLKESSSSWDEALGKAGGHLRHFRSKSPDHSRENDYQEVKDHLLGHAQLARGPARAGFGLPLTFRYNSIPKGTKNGLTFHPSGGERWASPLLIRVVRLGKSYHAVFVRLASSPPGTKVQGRLSRQRSDGQWDWHEGAPRIVDQFLDDNAAKLLELRVP
jgi:CRISPR-associated protein Cmr1